ncbi:MAG: hypothetical protein LWW93_02010 [Hyphomicrobiales bacterium]|nr:hypothetical protein [Hyphomicrobiales bacterium]
MPEPGILTSKVRSYMESLSPTARAMLVRTLRAAGHVDLPSEVILKAAEGLDLGGDVKVRGACAVDPWSARLERAFFDPVAPFLVDDDPIGPSFGRISRRRLTALWNWIHRDLAAAAWERALAADPFDVDADARPIGRTFRAEVAPLLVDRLREVSSDPKARQKLSGHLGGEAAFRALSDIGYILQNEAAFADLFAQVPSAVTAFDVADSSRFVDAVRVASERGRLSGDWIAAVIATRAANPIVLVLLACRLAGATDPRIVASGRSAAFVEAVIARIEQHAAQAAARGDDEASRRAFLSDLRAYHDLTRNFELALPVESVSAWFRRLGAARRAMSDVVARQLEAAPGLVRRALRVDNNGGWAGRFDATGFADAEFAVRVTLEARLAVDSLAVNELALRARKQVESTLELVSNRLMDELKSPHAHDRDVLLAAVDGAIRLCGLVFGEDYAAVLRKSRDNGVAKQARAAG